MDILLARMTAPEIFARTKRKEKRDDKMFQAARAPGFQSFSAETGADSLSFSITSSFVPRPIFAARNSPTNIQLCLPATTVAAATKFPVPRSGSGEWQTLSRLPAFSPPGYMPQPGYSAHWDFLAPASPPSAAAAPRLNIFSPRSTPFPGQGMLRQIADPVSPPARNDSPPRPIAGPAAPSRLKHIPRPRFSDRVSVPLQIPLSPDSPLLARHSPSRAATAPGGNEFPANSDPAAEFRGILFPHHPISLATRRPPPATRAPDTNRPRPAPIPAKPWSRDPNMRAPLHKARQDPWESREPASAKNPAPPPADARSSRSALHPLPPSA